MGAPEVKTSRNRRAEYAALTRQAVVDAARKLYAGKGFFATTVEEIAAEADVAPATVYASCGGKYGLLNTLLEQWTSAPVIKSTYERVSALADGEAIVRATAAGTREVRETWGDVMRVVLATAPHDARVAASLGAATAEYRAGVKLTARRLADIGALRNGVDVRAATDILWFYFGYSSYFTLTDENGWSFAKAERWLLEQASAALF
jgi:AcrR family transcriptional regulator